MQRTMRPKCCMKLPSIMPNAEGTIPPTIDQTASCGADTKSTRRLMIRVVARPHLAHHDIDLQSAFGDVVRHDDGGN